MRFHVLMTAILVAYLPAMAFFNSTPEGNTVFSFTEHFRSARTAALGGAGGAFAFFDMGLALENPASWRSGARTHNFLGQWQSGGLTEGEGLLGHSTTMGAWRTLLLHGWQSHGEIAEMDESGESTGRNFSPRSQFVAAGLARHWAVFDWGFTARWIGDQLTDLDQDQMAMGWALDWGLQWIPASPQYGLAIAFTDMGKQFRAYTEDGMDDAPLNATVRLSGFYRPAALPRLTVHADGEAPRSQPARLKLGGEYSPNPMLTLRAGTQKDFVQLSRMVESISGSEKVGYDYGSIEQFALGAGLRLPRFTFDYAYSHLIDGLGSEHRFSIHSGF